MEDFTVTNINNSIITNNYAYNGGGIMITSKDSLYITDCYFGGNVAVLNGGAMTFDDERNLELSWALGRSTHSSQCEKNTKSLNDRCPLSQLCLEE